MGGCNSKDTGAASTSHNSSAVVASSGVTNNNKQTRPQATSTSPVKKEEKMVSLYCVFIVMFSWGYVVRRGVRVYESLASADGLSLDLIFCEDMRIRWQIMGYNIMCIAYISGCLDVSIS